VRLGAGGTGTNQAAEVSQSGPVLVTRPEELGMIWLRGSSVNF